MSQENYFSKLSADVKDKPVERKTYDLPDGKYAVECLSSALEWVSPKDTTKDTFPVWKMDCVILDGEQAGMHAFYGQTIGEKSIGFIRADMRDVFGIDNFDPAEFESAQFIESFIGKRFELKLKTNKDKTDPSKEYKNWYFVVPKKTGATAAKPGPKKPF